MNLERRLDLGFSLGEASDEMGWKDLIRGDPSATRILRNKSISAHHGAVAVAYTSKPPSRISTW